MKRAAMAMMLVGCAAASQHLRGEQETVQAGATQACSISADTTVVLYNGLGAGTYSKQWEDHFWGWWSKENPEILVATVTGPNMALASGCALRDFPKVKVYVQPGGDAYKMQSSIKAAGRSNILDFMQRGGKYVGTCAGWYFASKSYVWQNVSYAWPNVLDIFDKEVEGSLTTIADYEANPAYKVTPIKTGSGDLNVVYYGGPTVGWTKTAAGLPSGWSADAEFTAPHVVGCPAVVTKSNALLMSPHFEAFEGIGVSTLTTQHRLANYQYRARQINALLGTNWKIPESP